MNTFLRAGGLAAVAGGVLRTIDTFAAEALTQGPLAVLYFVTDVFLLAGVAGLWWKRRASLGIAGAGGLAIFVLGILVVRASALGVGSYQLGATIALLGLALYSVETLITRRAPVWAPSIWLLSLAAGIAATGGLQPVAMTALAGIAFGVGFVVAGVEILRR
jgi:hypothetical protein